MQRSLEIKVFQEEPIEFSLTFEGNTPDPTVIYAKAPSEEAFVEKMKLAGWEVEKGEVRGVELDPSPKWFWEIHEDGKAIDGNLGYSSKEEAEDDAKAALEFITRNDPRRIKVCIWPGTGKWCRLENKDDCIAEGYGNEYICRDMDVAVVWNPKTQKVEEEPDQDYYIAIEVDEFVKQFQIREVAKAAGVSGTLEEAARAVRPQQSDLTLN